MEFDLKGATPVPPNRSEDIYKLGDEASDAMLSGINRMANLVKVTLGPKGRPVLLINGRNHRFTYDGVSIARQTAFLNTLDNAAATVIKEILECTVDDEGDGTTTSLVLTQAIVNKGREQIKKHKCNPVDVKRGIDATVNNVCKLLNGLAHKIVVDNKVNFKLLQDVAMVSCNGDVELAKVIAEAIYKVGVHGYVKLKDARNKDCSYKITKGIQYDKGLRSMDFAHNEDGITTTFENPLIFVADFDISDDSIFTQVLQFCLDNRKPLVVVARKIHGAAEEYLRLNATKNHMPISIVNPPHFGKLQEDVLEDIAIMAGTNVCKGVLTGNQIKIEELGQIATFHGEEFKATFEPLDIVETHQPYLDRVEQLKNRMKEHEDQDDFEFFQRRYSQLTGGCANIYIGGVTPSEIDERKDRAEDAYLACKGALRNGVLPGGGISLNYIADHYHQLMGVDEENGVYNASDYGFNHDMMVGETIILDAIKVPFEQILINAGLDSNNIRTMISNVITKDNTLKCSQTGYNSRTNEVEDFFDTGVVDPASVTTTALSKAASIASLTLTMGGLLIRDSY